MKTRYLLICILTFALVPAHTSAQTKRALVIGISEYPDCGKDSWTAIHGANDAAMIVPVLKRQGFLITKICNREATAKRIRHELGKLSDTCKSGDHVYLHFSCHGQAYEDQDGDEEDGWDEALIPYDAPMTYDKGRYKGANHITDDELHRYTQAIRGRVGRSGLVCVVVDACHSGGVSRGDEAGDDTLCARGCIVPFSPNGKPYRPRIDTRGRFHISSGKQWADIIVIEACRSYQTNNEIRRGGKYYGALSYYVGKVLSRHAISSSLSWVKEVENMMNNDKNLRNQNIVYETSITQIKH